jgi:hypothetical protein
VGIGWNYQEVRRVAESEGILDLLQSLYIMNAGDLANSVDDSLQVLQVGDFEDYVDVGLSVFGACRNVTDIGVSVADDGGNLF